VITDVRLPGEIDGLDLVRQIHETHPETHIIVITAYGTVETAVEAMRRGAYDFVTKPIDLNVIRHQVQQAAEHHRLVTENHRLRDQLAEVGTISEIVGNCKATHDVLRQVRQVAQTDATVLILGESGTGKELTARAIHQLSPRHDKPFVTVNMGALPDSLLESELFGHEKGAFTDAIRQKIGSFEAAHEGTIFLDEVTETSPKSQVELLRVLEAREIRRVGGDKTIPIDVRVVSATNKDFDDLIRDGEFREDLYYRLNVIPIRVPALRERREDIPLLVEHFLNHFCKRYGREPKRMAVEAMNALISFGWPGNVRQLRNFMERLVVTVPTDVVHLADLPAETISSPSAVCGSLSTAVEEAERNAILAALASCNYHREKTAKLLNISIRSLHYKMNRYGLH
ncbi:MAG: sigma-54-dependent Fis family transcriptional regulator, partial [Planctomycetales bacterium]|nr:sigma-54-dependent Fis family transcriptional regulator [Planctomycetales bacterium]